MKSKFLKKLKDKDTKLFVLDCIGVICALCGLCGIFGLLVWMAGNSDTALKLVILGVLGVLAFIGILKIRTKIEEDDGSQSNSVDLYDTVTINQVSKKSILENIYNKDLFYKKYSLLISFAIALGIFLLIILHRNNVSNIIYLVFLECIVIAVGVSLFITACNRVRKHNKLELVFYRRPVAGIYRHVGIDGEQDKLEFKFEDFKNTFEMVDGVNFSNEIDIGDDCVLVCYKNSMTIQYMYCMKHWNIEQDILNDLCDC